MTEHRAKLDRWIPWLAALGLLALGLGLLALLGFDFSSKLIHWRDHPFDRSNLRFAAESFSFSTRLWGYDPMHLFGWTPNVFYNPLASLAAGAFSAPFNYSPAAYVVWLLGLLWITSLAGWALLPRGTTKNAWLAGAAVAGGLTWLVYPTDVGLIDANPVQVLYTGQWAQRLGIALGLLSLERFWRALLAMDDGQRRRAAERGLAAAALWGASLFAHFMSGYATAVGLGLLSLHHMLARRLAGKRFGPAPLLVLLGVSLAMALLYADFFAAFFGLQADFHNLPLLRWELPDGAFATVRDVLIPALPLLLLPGLVALGQGERDRRSLAKGGLPLLVFTAAAISSPAHMLLWCIGIIVSGLIAARMEGRVSVRHWLPSVAFSLWTLACAPDSLHLFGLDLSLLLPFSASLGFAKFAAFARLAFIAWLGLLAADSLNSIRPPSRWLQALAWILLLSGMALPLSLSISADKGAQTFFTWIAQGDDQGTQALRTRMLQVAGQVDAGHHVLMEDPLHHAEDSALAGRGLPHGHIVYDIGPEAGRPVLGGSVTTRYLTHPYAQTARGQILCEPAEGLDRADLDRLAELGVERLLVHSPALIKTLQGMEGVEYLDSEHGLHQFQIMNAQTILTDTTGRPVPGAAIRWLDDGFRLHLPAKTPQDLRLRMVYLPYLKCTGDSVCHISAWREKRDHFAGCDLAAGKELSVQVPWIALRISSTDDPQEIEIKSRPPQWSWILMLLAWTLAGFWRFIWTRPTSDDDRDTRNALVKTRLLRTVQALIILAVLFFVSRAFATALHRFDLDRLRLDPWTIGVALGIGLLGLIPITLVYRIYLRALGHAFSLRQSLVLCTLPRLGTFVPGKVGSVVGLAWLGHRMGSLPLRSSMTFAILLMVQSVFVSALVAATLSLWVPMDGLWRTGLIVMASIGLLALHPGLVRGPMGILLKRLGREPLVESRGGYGLALGMAGLILLVRLLTVAAWLWLAQSMLDLPFSSLPAVGLAFVLAGLAGFLVFFVPAGLGVQEGIMLLLLSPHMPTADAAALTLAARLFQIVVLLIGAGLGASLLPGAGKSPTDHS